MCSVAALSFYRGIFLDFTFKYHDQSLEFGLLDFGGLSVCTGALRHNQYFTGYTKSVLLLHQHTMLKIVYVSHLGFLYSVVHWRTGIMTSGNNLGNRGRIPGKYSAWFVCFRSMTSSDLAAYTDILMAINGIDQHCETSVVIRPKYRKKWCYTSCEVTGRLKILMNIKQKFLTLSK